MGGCFVVFSNNSSNDDCGGATFHHTHTHTLLMLHNPLHPVRCARQISQPPNIGVLTDILFLFFFITIKLFQQHKKCTHTHTHTIIIA